MADELVLVDNPTDSTRILTINRPKALNALNLGVLKALRSEIQRAEEDGIRQLVVTGSGNKSFVAGADIASMASMNLITSMISMNSIVTIASMTLIDAH